MKKSSGAFTKLGNRSPAAQGWAGKQCPASSALQRLSPRCPLTLPGAPSTASAKMPRRERARSSAQEAARGGSPRREWPDAIQTAPANVEIYVLKNHQAKEVQTNGEQGAKGKSQNDQPRKHRRFTRRKERSCSQRKASL